jgi:hypothetical protein
MNTENPLEMRPQVQSRRHHAYASLPQSKSNALQHPMSGIGLLGWVSTDWRDVIGWYLRAGFRLRMSNTYIQNQGREKGEMFQAHTSRNMNKDQNIEMNQTKDMLKER